ncbi:M24 family metallopeptidase [Thermanaerovibrio acidaminovorans]|uniref:M24 family metallopeptidase n=1 Tax=Thermanaerovibrio acidaminovorans TaxID=81462 RepID=UPI002490615F|nr:Xaa-Pro peptidase family protein [Thermanaerovibrio acidaminovorans]
MVFDVYAERVGRLLSMMDREGLDGFFVLVVEGLNWESAYYLSGYRGSSAAFLVSRHGGVLITDGRYLAQARSQSPFEVEDQGGRSLNEALLDRIRRMGLRRVGFEADRIFHSTFLELHSHLGGSLVDCSRFMPELRRTKDRREADLIAEAARICADAFLETLSLASPGMTEREFASMLEQKIVSSGAEGGWGSHSFIVASGPRSALPHGVPTDRVLCQGEWFTVDFGARYQGYVCDVTRNVAVGSLDPWARDVYHVLVAAQDQAVRAMMEGERQASQVDQAARRVIQEAGMGDLFSHGLGHGLGLEVHEAPRVSSRSQDVLAPGDVITVEPGIYLEGKGGLRVEDDYLISSQGVECLSSPLPREMFVIR